MDRRDFFHSTAAGLAVATSAGFADPQAAAKPIRVGLIGTGWYGKCDLLRLLQVAPNAEVVSLCDVDRKMLAGAADTIEGPAGVQEAVTDLRRLPRDAQGEGPRRGHGRDAGPLARDADDRRVRGRGRRLGPEAARRGRGGGEGHARRRPQARPGRAGGDPAAEHAAPGRGQEGVPRRGEARQDRPGRDLLLLPHADAREPAGRGAAGAPRLHFDVVWQHRTYGSSPDPQYPWGATFYGDKGTLKASVMGYDFTPQCGISVRKDVTCELDKFPEDQTEKDLEKHVAPAIRAHWLDFLKARENRTKPVADIEQGHISSASCILANLSQKLGRTLTWDPEKHRIVGDDGANGLLKRPYRQPWQHPAG